MTFQSTLSARRATEGQSQPSVSNIISIHALREESDPPKFDIPFKYGDFNPRSPRGERPQTYTNSKSKVVFQSTLSARRATPLTVSKKSAFVFQSTLSARRATLYSSTLKSLSQKEFQSTLSARRATHWGR